MEERFQVFNYWCIKTKISENYYEKYYRKVTKIYHLFKAAEVYFYLCDKEQVKKIRTYVYIIIESTYFITNYRLLLSLVLLQRKCMG